MTSPLAIYGGFPTIKCEFPKFNTFDDKEILVASKVLETGNLSSYLGAPGDKFYGGEQVLGFENEFAKEFRVKNAISINSWTSGLWAIIGALDLEPGSEVLVSSWTMAATATTILHWGLIPIFTDINPLTFNMDFEDICRKTTAKTKAIISPDIFGLSAENKKIRDWCDAHNLIFVSDSAQSPLATDGDGNLTSTLCHIGGFSLNYHKHIHVGEGGVVVTSDDNLAERVRMLRNHGEVAVGFGNSFQRRQRGILGMNLRLGEIEAAIGRVQLEKVHQAVSSRREAGTLLNKSLSNLAGLRTVYIPDNYKHSFYVSGFILDYAENNQLPTREKLLLALKAEGVPALMAGYQSIHKLPLFADQFAIGETGWPYSLLNKTRREEIGKFQLPTVESYHNKLFFGINLCAHNYDEEEINLISKAFLKVWENLGLLKNTSKNGN